MFAKGPGDRGSVPSRLIPETQKMIFDAALLNTQYYKVKINVKLKQSRYWSGAPLLHFGVVLLKREPSGHPRQRSPTLLYFGLHVNAHKTEYMCYNQTGDISTLDGTPLKLVDKFTYLENSVSSTEKDIDTRLTKAWTAIDRLSIIWPINWNALSSRQRSYRYCCMDALLGR